MGQQTRARSRADQQSGRSGGRSGGRPGESSQPAGRRDAEQPVGQGTTSGPQQQSQGGRSNQKPLRPPTLNPRRWALRRLADTGRRGARALPSTLQNATGRVGGQLQGAGARSRRAASDSKSAGALDPLDTDVRAGQLGGAVQSGAGRGLRGAGRGAGLAARTGMMAGRAAHKWLRRAKNTLIRLIPYGPAVKWTLRVVLVLAVGLVALVMAHTDATDEEALREMEQQRALAEHYGDDPDGTSEQGGDSALVGDDPLEFADHFRDPEGSTSPMPPTREQGLITAATRDTVNEVVTRFGQGDFHCHRDEATSDGGEHPLGRACDFMTNSDQLPATSVEERARGDAIAAFLIDEADRLNVRYIIWQKQIWYASTGTWDDYTRYDDGEENCGRGPHEESHSCNTLHHYDHVHVTIEP